jgi:micrococcal nuclease
VPSADKASVKRLSRIFVLAAFAILARAENFSGKVVAITDGDTIKTIHNGLAERVRLWGTDCPE